MVNICNFKTTKIIVQDNNKMILLLYIYVTSLNTLSRSSFYCTLHILVSLEFIFLFSSNYLMVELFEK